jgi:hypothetical protein
MYNSVSEMIVSDSRSIFFITSSVGMVLLYVLTVIAREETLGCQERKLSNRKRGISLLVWKDHKLEKVVVLNSIFHRKLVEVVTTSIRECIDSQVNNISSSKI